MNYTSAHVYTNSYTADMQSHFLRVEIFPFNPTFDQGIYSETNQTPFARERNEIKLNGCNSQTP